MVEAQKIRIEQQMTEMVNQLDKNYLRKMQVWFGYVTAPPPLGVPHHVIEFSAVLRNNLTAKYSKATEVFLIYLSKSYVPTENHHKN